MSSAFYAKRSSLDLYIQTYRAIADSSMHKLVPSPFLGESSAVGFADFGGMIMPFSIGAHLM